MYPWKCACGRKVEVQKGVTIKEGRSYKVCCAVCAADDVKAIAAADAEAKAKQQAGRAIDADGTITLPYSDDEGQRALLRALPLVEGSVSAWDKQRRCWVASVTQQDLRRTLEVARRLELKIAPELLEREKILTEEARAAAKIEGLYPFQPTGVEFLASGDNRLLADDQGTGKTVMALCALPRTTLVPVLCVVPNVVKFNWAVEAAKWAPMYRIQVLSGRKSWRWPQAGEIVILNYDILPQAAEQPDVKSKKEPEVKMAHEAAHRAIVESAPKDCIVIVDEVHNCRNNSARSKRVRGLMECSKRVWGLSGTPLMNNPIQLWRVLGAIGAQGTVFGGWNGFVRLFQGSQNRWGGWEFGEPLPEVPERMRRVMLRRTKAEVLPDLPPKRYQTITVNQIGAALRKELDRLWEEWGELIGTDGDGDLPPFEEISEIRERLAASRVESVLEWVEPYEDAKDPLVVFSAHRAPVDALGEREGWETITGDTKAEKKTAIVQRFQDGELAGVACTIQAAGVGLTLTRASTALFVDLDWTPALNLQAQDRLHRIGQTAEGVLYVRMVSDHPLDKHVQALIAKKMELIDRSIERLVKVQVKDAPAAQRPSASQDLAEHVEREAWAIREAEKQEARDRCRSITARQRARLAEDAPELPLTDARVKAIRQALDAMLEVCDGAERRDGQGFNKPDAVRSRWLDVLGLNDEDAQRCALSMLQGYRRQLKKRFPILWKEVN
jgi:SWI/SNF-related matrix-associated actin-dependent regulator 1 of chromatin subfamily A